MELLLDGLETERLLFRKLLPSDFDAWLPFHEDSRTSAFWSGLPKDPNEACQQDFKRTFYRYSNDLGGRQALIHRKNQELVGLAGLLVQEVDGQQEVEIAYSLLPKFWKKGYATEAAVKCKQFTFENHLAESLISIIHIDNIPSQKVAMGVGMQLDKTTFYKSNPVNIYRILA
ncbi:GNAT family N-acetyltransferase [Flavobacteriaceae bacterium TP-CH-4]|uniref:GNAT family N-acetyltransferase n=1 Tax=Pelagihabitans pacificus TaxID=2696054 RepID=A0A967AS79_9FLAO|nr:GNAT family N-acetyltransferase [Pelagihabitans pacificus]NHF57973.1 GNAT family N-acetyltransferase [Pelagihabitans pacificus]